jgi:hypothetical protein
VIDWTTERRAHLRADCARHRRSAPPDAAVDNLIKMTAYVDKRASSVDRSRLADYSILKELLKK